MKIKIYKRLVSLILTGTTLFLLSSCKKNDNIEEKFSSGTILTSFSNEILLDDLLSDENKEIVEKISFEEDLLDKVTKLEEYLKKSEELNSLKLEEYNVNLDLINVDQLENFDNYYDDILKYKELNNEIKNKTILNDDNIELYIIVNKLKQYENMANNWLLINGYRIAEEYGKLAIKSIVMEANDMVDISNINRITINPNPDWRSDNEIGNSNCVKIDANTENEVTLFFKKNSLENQIVCEILNCQENQNKKMIENGKYNEARNNILSGLLNDVKLTIPMVYVIDDDEIKSVVTIKGSRSIINNKVKIKK